MLEQSAGLVRAARVDRIFPFFDVLDDAVFVNHESRAVREPVFLVQNTVLLRGRPLEVTEEGKCQAFLLRKGSVGWKTVHADAQDLCAGFLEFGDIRLIRLELPRSASGKGQDIKCQHHILLSQKVAQLYILAVLVRQGEARRFVANF